MKIAIITPYHKESTEFLKKCHQSVIAQNVPADHFFVADGFPNNEVSNWGIKHISLPQAHGDCGDTPRGIGGIIANVEGYDFIAFLDADNWFHQNHLSSLLNLWEQTGADICTSFRTFHTQSGELMAITENSEETLKHVDTSCYFWHRNAFDSLDIWLKIPKNLHPIGDRVFLSGLRHKKYRIFSTKKRTVAYRSQYKEHYLSAKIEVPREFKENVGAESIKWLTTTAGMKEAVNKLGFFPLG